MDTAHPNIVLTGFMGTGKTVVGRLLADRLGRDFVDTDAVIADRHGSITSIFDEHGEEGFRTIERELASELADRENLVISTGGRLMLDPVNVESLGGASRVFCLSATPATILQRLISDRSLVDRPLLSAPNPQHRIIDLLAERAPLYLRFEQVDTDDRSTDDVADDIVERLGP